MPPACNTGVHPPSVGLPFAGHSRFDWYRATVPAHLDILLSACLDLGGPEAVLTEGNGRFNYHRSHTIMARGDRVATILSGGPNGHPNVEASGERAQLLAEMLRDGGAHRVTRCDVAADFYGDNAFEDLERVALGIAEKHGVAIRKIANPRDKEAGETVYLGSRQSTVFGRIYEKGKADRLHYGELEPALLRPWVRCELEVKPQKDMKAKAATMAPEAFWGVSAWSAQLAQEALQLDTQPVPFHPRRTASDDRAFATMCAQYRNLLRRRCADRHAGDRMALAREIVASIFDEQADEAA